MREEFERLNFDPDMLDDTLAPFKRGRGRPRKDAAALQAPTAFFVNYEAANEGQEQAISNLQIKKKRGRPRKNVDNFMKAEISEVSSSEQFAIDLRRSKRASIVEAARTKGRERMKQITLYDMLEKKDQI